MSIEELVKKEWVINRDNGLIFMPHPLMQMGPNFGSYAPTTAEIVAGCKLDIPVVVTAFGGDEQETAPIIMGGGTVEFDALRADKIKDAVLAVPTGSYVAAAFGRPTMPKVSDIKVATGYDDVTADEIVAAMAVPEEVNE